MLRRTGHAGEVLDAVAQALCEGLQECAAARRAGLVQFHARHHALIHEDGLHVLTTDVEDKRNVGGQVFRSPVVRHRLDDATVERESRLDQFLAIARGARPHDVQPRIRRCRFLLQQYQPVAHGFDGVAQTLRVVAEQDVAVLPCRDNLSGCRARVYAQHNRFLRLHRQHSSLASIFLLLPLAQCCVVPEQRFKV